MLLRFRHVAGLLAALSATASADSAESVATSSNRALPPPLASSGPRVDVEGALVLPTGDLSDGGASTSFSPTVRVGYEHLFGNFGIGGGFQGRFTKFRMGDDSQLADTAWLLETHAYVRAALHIGRLTSYTGVSLGLDLANLGYNSTDQMDGEGNTSAGFGMNILGGLQVAATPTVAFDVGADYHVPTDSMSIADTSVSASYFALRLGATFRL
jgi:hypothetical protein